MTLSEHTLSDITALPSEIAGELVAACEAHPEVRRAYTTKSLLRVVMALLQVDHTELAERLEAAVS